MVRAGANTADLALVFGISRRMVQKDLAASRTLNRDLVDKADHCELLGEEVDAWREIIRRAMERFWLATHDNARVGFLRAAIDARAKLNKLLQDSGLITRVPTRVSLEGEFPFKHPAVRQAALEFMILCREMGEPVDGL